MQMNHTVFTNSPALRASLKRGIARQAVAQADADAADLPRLFHLARDLRPNRKAAERLAGRLGRQQGIVRVAHAPARGGLAVTARILREVCTRAAGAEVFRETALVYLRIGLCCTGGRVSIALTGLGFCHHALERLVERSALPLDSALLPALDAEALDALRGLEGGRLIEDADDQFVAARVGGVWAGSLDRMAPEEDWGLQADSGIGIALFSARTFLGPGEMRPTVWLRWNDDPACRIA